MLFQLLGLPFKIPSAGMKFVFNTLVETAEQELMDDAPVKEELMLLHMQLEEGEIEEDEFAEREAYLFQRLRDIRAYREEKLRGQLEALGMAEQDDEDGAESPRRVAVIDADLGDSIERG